MSRPVTMTREHRRFLIVEEIVGSSIVNFLLNAGIAWYLFRAASSVPLWGKTSVAADTLVTAFVLPVLTAIIATIIVRLQVARGKLLVIPAADIRASSWWLRRSGLRRGLWLGAIAVPLIGVPVVLLLALVGPPAFSVRSFILFKGSFAAGVGAIVTPLLGWWAIVDASRRV